MKRGILVAGIGNIFFGDDAFGVEVVRELRLNPMPPEVVVEDFGIRGYDLAFAIMKGYRATILVDAAPRGGAPGTLYLIKPDAVADAAPSAANAHGMTPLAVLEIVRAYGADPGDLYLVACEPGVLDCPEGELGLSPAVKEAVPKAAEMVRGLVNRLVDETLSSDIMEMEQAGPAFRSGGGDL